MAFWRVAGKAIAARQAAVREALAKVRYSNLLNLRKFRKKNKNLDSKFLKISYVFLCPKIAFAALALTCLCDLAYCERTSVLVALNFLVK